jgi:hypothetical protein
VSHETGSVTLCLETSPTICQLRSGSKKDARKGVLLRNDGRALSRKERGRELWLGSMKHTSACMLLAGSWIEER